MKHKRQKSRANATSFVWRASNAKSRKKPSAWPKKNARPPQQEKLSPWLKHWPQNRRQNSLQNRLQTPTFEPDNTQQMRIDAAIQRAKAQVAAEHPNNTEVLTPQQKAEIAEIEARRAKIREMASNAGSDDEPSKKN